uniref:Salt-induced S1 n=1 Tax=Halogeton glomeratus TaxID=454499 RepID=A0A1P8LI07_9CARY|nr:salt-induced S1 [Halogeton glomeratus]
MESHKRRRTSEGEIEEERYLCMGSNGSLFCIDLKKTEEKYGGFCCEFSNDPPTAVVVWNIQTHTKSLPLGMTPTRFNFRVKTSGILVPCSTASDTLLIGGEVEDPETPLRALYASNQIYKVTPELSASVKGEVTNLRIELADPRIPRMKSGKARAVVEEIGGNLYVLHSRFAYQDIHAQPDIPFEVFDSKIGQWRTLPTPPFFAARTGTVVYAHTVLGASLVVETSRECFSFDTITEQWSCSETMTSNLPNRLPMIIPTSLPPFGEGLVVGITLMVQPAAYLIRTCDGSLVSMQSLYEVIFSGMLAEPLNPVINCQLIPLISSDHKIIRMCACALITQPDFRSRALLISFFSAKISPSSQQLINFGNLSDDDPTYNSFLDIEVERKLFLRVDNIDYFLDPPAFFL